MGIYYCRKCQVVKRATVKPGPNDPIKNIFDIVCQHEWCDTIRIYNIEYDTVKEKQAELKQEFEFNINDYIGNTVINDDAELGDYLLDNVRDWIRELGDREAEYYIERYDDEWVY